MYDSILFKVFSSSLATVYQEFRNRRSQREEINTCRIPPCGYGRYIGTYYRAGLSMVMTVIGLIGGEWRLDDVTFSCHSLENVCKSYVAVT